MTAPVADVLGDVGHRLPEAILLVDGRGVVLDANRAACAVFQKTVEHLRSRDLGQFVKTPLDDVSRYLQACAGSGELLPGSLTVESNGTETVYRCDGAVVRPAAEGREATILVRLRERDASIRQFRVLSEKVGELAREIGSRRLAEQLVEGQRRVLELIAQGAPLEDTLSELVRITEEHSPGELRASILLLDEEGRLRDGAGQSLPQAYRDAIDGLAIGPEVGSCGTAAYCKREVVVTDIATDPLWRDFKDLALSYDLHACWSTPIPARDGSVLGTFALYYDRPRHPDPEDRRVVAIVTRTASIAIERRRVDERLEEALRRERAARDEAERANRAKDEFLAVVSHELRNPLNAIVGWIQILQDERIDDAMRTKGLKTIDRNARLQSELISDVLDFSRITSGRFKLSPQSTDLFQVVEKACESVRPEATASGLTLELESEIDGDPVMVDPDRLQQAVSNVLWNAIKFTPEGGRIDVRLSERDGVGSIEVRDTGCGIEPEFLPSVFDRFRQADSSRSRKHQGLGLGLAIVRHIVELHGGDVTAHSDGPGTGATFTLSIPLTPAPAHEVPEPARETGPRLDGVRVLVVDDAEDTRDLLEVTLGRAGARVTTASSGREALAGLETERPDVLVCDIGMPDMDGYEVIRRWRAGEPEGPRLPAIALTAYAREEDRRQALDAGFDRHQSKPLDPTTLITLIADLAN